MNCKLCQKELDAYHEGRLPIKERDKVENHMEKCSKCTEELQLLLLADRVINQEKVLLPNPFLPGRIMAQIEKIENPLYKPNTPKRKILQTAIMSTSVAAAIFFGIIIGSIYKPALTENNIPVELALIDDASIESVDILLNE